MTALSNHLEQISISSKSIAEIEFPVPQIFTNALIGDHEITTLIRDTEPHERALFSLDPAVTKGSSSRRATQASGIFSGETNSYGRRSIYENPQHLKKSAVARVLGPAMIQEIRQSNGNDHSKGHGANVEILLKGAEKLCDVYSVPGVQEKIIALRNRHQQILSSISSYEEKVKTQQSKLNQIHQSSEVGESLRDPRNGSAHRAETVKATFTEQDFHLEEEEIRELEAKKKALEIRVSEMEKDLGGLLS